MRLIDADEYIKYCDENWIPLNVDAVNAQPTIDAVPVVRCRDCSRKKYCNFYLIHGCDENNFCSFGVRKND